MLNQATHNKPSHLKLLAKCLHKSARNRGNMSWLVEILLLMWASV